MSAQVVKTAAIPSRREPPSQSRLATLAAADKPSAAIPATATPNTPQPGGHPQLVERYSIVNLLGQGGSAFVYHAVRRSDNQPCAIKFLYRSRVPDHRLAIDQDPHGQRIVLPMEVYILRRLQHPNIIALLDFFEDEQFFYIVTEFHGRRWANVRSMDPIDAHANSTPRAKQSMTSSLVRDSDDSFFSRATKTWSVSGDSRCSSSSSPPTSPFSEPPAPHHQQQLPPQPHGAAPTGDASSVDLFDCIERQGRLPEPVARSVFSQIISAIAYLKSRNVFHLDIKDENIVIDEHYRVKLIDFGSAQVLPLESASRPVYMKTFLGTYAYASPEILVGGSYQPEWCDVWSLGTLLYTMVYGQCPFGSVQRALNGQLDALRRELEEPLSIECIQLLSGMLQPNPHRRITIERIRDSGFCAPLLKECKSQQQRDSARNGHL